MQQVNAPVKKKNWPGILTAHKIRYMYEWSLSTWKDAKYN